MQNNKKNLFGAIAKLLANEFGWDIGSKNIALTNGSQSAFFILFNMFAGAFEGGAVMSLAPGSMGAAIATNLVRSGEIIRLSRDVIRPFYEKKAGEAVEQLCEGLDGIDFHIHKPEGAFFLWLWLRGLPITDEELYQSLKQRGVLIVPGHYFFPGLKAEWKHKHECIRINYAQDEEIVSAGLKIIADEVKHAYDGD